MVSIGDSDTTGWDPKAPAVWLITRGRTLILLVNGHWRLAAGSLDAVEDYVEHDDDRADALQSWLNSVWPAISGIRIPCCVEKTRSGADNEALIEKMLTIPILMVPTVPPAWAIRNPEIGKRERATELDLERADPGGPQRDTGTGFPQSKHAGQTDDLLDIFS